MDTALSDQLKELVDRHNVCWNVVPLYAATGAGVHPIGYEIRLLGVHDEHASAVMPGCPQCLEVYRDLRQIAQAALPPPDRPSKYVMDAFDHALRFSSNEKLPPAVQIKVEVRHRKEWDAPVDPCEDQCVKEITDALTQLGAPQRRWPLV